MKKTFAAFGLAALLLFAACTPQEDPTKVKSVTIVPDNVNLVTGATRTLSYEVLPSTAQYDEVTWSTDDQTVAKVSRKGLVTAVGAGQTDIRLDVGGVTSSCLVTVVESGIAVDGVSLDRTEATIGIGEVIDLTATVTPANAGLKTVSWSSSNLAAASVEDGTVRGIAVGSAIITVTTDDGGFTAECSVTVVSNDLQSIAFAGASETAKLASMGSQETIAVTFTPKTATVRNLRWKSSDSSIATVASAGDGLGQVTFLQKAGPVVITAEAEGNSSISASQAYFVKGTEPLCFLPEGTIYSGKKMQYRFNSAAYPGATSVKWSNGRKEETGESVMLAVDKAGENTVTMTAAFGEVVLQDPITVNAEEWYMDIDIPEGLGGYNTIPVFSPDGTKAYVMLSGTRRSLLEIKLAERSLGWKYDFSSDETGSANGGHIAVNPKTGDIICQGTTRFYCITPSGELKWKSEQLETNIGRNANMYSGCGPAFSNDCSVVFALGTPRGLFAFDMADGTTIDSVRSWNDGTDNPESNQGQFGVYGDNNICLHLKNLKIVFCHFDGKKFSELGRAATIVAEKYVTDLTSCAITADQKTAYFSGYSVFSVNLETMQTVAGIQDGTKWHNSPSITDDGHMYQIQGGYAGSNAAVLYYDLKPELTTGKCVFKNGIGGDDGMKFSSSPCDTEGNAYFCFWDKSEDKIGFYRSVKGAEAELIAQITAKTHNGTNGFFQGSFNFSDGYLVATTGGVSGGNFAGKVLVHCIDAERGHGWSGHGGDICSTKNANLVYSK